MRRPVCLLALLFIAALRIAVFFFPPEPSVGEKADGRYVTLLGTVEGKEYAVRDPGGELYIKLTLGDARLASDIPQESGFAIGRGDKILCTVNEEPQMQQEWAREGASVRVRGKIRLFKRPSNDGEFDAFLYYSEIEGCLFTLADAHILAYNGERDPLRAALYDLRSSLTDTLDRIYKNRHGLYGSQCASILKAMLLGQSGLVDSSIKEKYQAAGIIHVICVSGLHISLIGSGIYAFLRKCRVPSTVSGVFCVVILYLYGILTGMHMSCIRALIMFGMRTAAKALGRTYDMLTAMAVAAVLLLIEQPMYLFHSGFLFSFAAVAAACLLVPEMPTPAKPFGIPLFTIPVHLCFYYTFPLYSLFLNMIVIALAPFVMAGGGISLLLGVFAERIPASVLLQNVFAGAAELAGEIPVLLLWLFERLCTVTEKLPFHTLIAGKPEDWLVILYYCLIALAMLLEQFNSGSRKKKQVLQMGICAVAVCMIFTLRFEPPMALYMWDVGQGDGLCIRTCDDSGPCTVLIDGGSSSRKGIGKNVEIPFLKFHGISKVDYCILTHDDMDHCSGLLEMLEQSDAPDGIRIGYLGLPSVAQECKGDTYVKIEMLAAQKGIPVTYLYRGMTFAKGKLRLDCIHPACSAAYEDANEYSAVMLLSYKKFSAVLTGDLEGQGEKDMLDYLGDRKIEADVLKAAHHGSKDGTSESFLKKISAKTALISCGAGNRYGHPAPATVQRITEAGMEIYDTRTDGQICITTDGRGRYSLETNK